MTPEDIVEEIVGDLVDVYDEYEIREWLREPGGSVEFLPTDFQLHIWLAIKLKRTARDVYQDFPYYITVPEFLEYWNRLSIASRLAHMASDRNNEDPFDCME